MRALPLTFALALSCATPPPPVPALPLPRPPAFLEDVPSPADNPTTAEKVHLGRALFFDVRLSLDERMRCESCHHVALAWTSGKPVDAKVGGKLNTRNAPPMTNLGLHTGGFYWDGRKPTLESVSEAAWTGQLAGKPLDVALLLNADPSLRRQFQAAFGGEATPKNIPMALAAFLRALQSGNSAWDRFEQGDKAAASAEAQKGFEVFREAGCALCHLPPLYSDTQFHNVGIGWDGKAFKDHGRMDATRNEADDGAFKTPSLRDLPRTAPYFHDGSAATLEEAVDRMLAGGVENPKRDAKLTPRTLSPEDRAALLAFLRALDGTSTLE